MDTPHEESVLHFKVMHCREMDKEDEHHSQLVAPRKEAAEALESPKQPLDRVTIVSGSGKSGGSYTPLAPVRNVSPKVVTVNVTRPHFSPSAKARSIRPGGDKGDQPKLWPSLF